MSEALVSYLRKWSLDLDGEILETPSSMLAPVRIADEPAFLKLFKASGDEHGSPQALLHFGGKGAVRVLKHDEGAVLLERIIPATPLADLVDAGRDDEATEIICAVAAKLHENRVVPKGALTLEDWFSSSLKNRTNRDKISNLILVWSRHDSDMFTVETSFSANC